MKLCHTSSLQVGAETEGGPSGSWASDPSVKILAVECVSYANDDCGAFGYLGNVMTHLLPSSSALDGPSVESSEAGQTILDFNAFLANKSHQFDGRVAKAVIMWITFLEKKRRMQ